MMQDRDFVFGWDSKSPKRSSGLFSVLKWFGNKDTVTPPPPDLVHSTSSSCDSIESVHSTDTVASFAFVPPTAYKPFGTALQPEKFILPGPETSTYRARLAQRDASRHSDRNLTLRSKYNLYKAPESERGHSLPLLSKSSVIVEHQVGMHRRTASESSKHRRAGAYCHVKGKRKAPQPPGAKNESTLRRKKRLAPQPPANPDIICNDSLKLDKGILKPAKETTETIVKVVPVEINHVAPKPWYKRTLARTSLLEKKPEIEKRKSGLSFLTNISELDREAMEIINKETLKMKYLKNASQAPEFMRPKAGEHSRTNSDSFISPKRKSARDLIAKFNAITGVSRMNNSSKESVKEYSPPVRETKPEFVIPVVLATEEATPSTSQPLKTTDSSAVTRTTAVVKPISRSQWNCPKCTLENDYWRIICRVCSTIKPYFDDFTTTSTSTGDAQLSNDDFKPEKKETNDLFGLGSTEMRISELQRSVFQSHYPKLSLNTNLKSDSSSESASDTPKVSETKNLFQSDYPRVSLNYDFKSTNFGGEKSANNSGASELPKVSDTRNMFQPQYPKISLNFNKEIELVSESPKTENLKTSDDKPRFNYFDFNVNKKQDASTSKLTNIEIEKKETQICKVDEKKIEKMILGDELSFKEAKKTTEDKKTNETVEGKTKIEKMILGDELSVEKPDYVNVNKYEKIEIDRSTDVNKNKSQKVEKIILGDEISVKSSSQTEEPPKMEKIILQKTNETGAIAKTCVKTKQLEDEKQNSAKREEREKLKKMLIEMKNSLPKRSHKTNEQKHRVSLIQEQSETEIETPESPAEEKTAEIIIATTETVYENIKVRKTNSEKPLKVSSSVQTNAVFRRNITPGESSAVKQSNPGFQLIGAKDFVGISNEKTGNQDGPSHTYANLNSTTTTMPDIFAGCSKTDTLEINRLLRRLETAISGGELGQAAVFARELAQLKVPLSVIRQKTDEADKNKGKQKLFNVDMYVEDKISHRGPFPLQVSESMSVAQLKNLVDEKYKIPRGVQRWILGKQLATDDCATLADHQISDSGCPIFLYLVAPGNETKTETNAIEISEVKDLENAQATVDEQPIAIVDAIIDEETDDDEAIVEEQLDENIQDLWKCRACTLLNPIATNECEVCGLVKDDVEENLADNQTYLQLVNLDNEDLVRNVETFECLICLVECNPGEGVTLRECLHQFCRGCLAHTVEFSEEAEVKCPYRDDQYACDLALQDREVKALVTPAIYEQHLAKSVKQAENKMDNTFHCKTPDCKGWCIYEDNVNDFHCPVCRKNNCLTCQAIHAGMNCKQYQEQMRTQSETDEDARRTRDFLEDMIKRGEALACPTCQVVLLKKWGCDWLRCSMCKTEICWVTRGPRWGPGGKGDTTGGCKCGVNGAKCHPKCNYCH